jgi:hypothetical protein
MKDIDKWLDDNFDFESDFSFKELHDSTLMKEIKEMFFEKHYSDKKKKIKELDKNKQIIVDMLKDESLLKSNLYILEEVFSLIQKISKIYLNERLFSLDNLNEFEDLKLKKFLTILNDNEPIPNLKYQILNHKFYSNLSNHTNLYIKSEGNIKYCYTKDFTREGRDDFFITFINEEYSLIISKHLIMLFEEKKIYSVNKIRSSFFLSQKKFQKEEASFDLIEYKNYDSQNNLIIGYKEDCLLEAKITSKSNKFRADIYKNNDLVGKFLKFPDLKEEALLLTEELNESFIYEIGKYSFVTKNHKVIPLIENIANVKKIKKISSLFYLILEEIPKEEDLKDLIEMNLKS